MFVLETGKNRLPATRRRMAVRRWCLLGILALGLMAWGTYRAVSVWRYRTELEQAGREIAAGRFVPARARLAALEAQWPGEADRVTARSLRAGAGPARPGQRQRARQRPAAELPLRHANAASGRRCGRPAHR